MTRILRVPHPIVFLSSLGRVEYRVLYYGPPAEAGPDSCLHAHTSTTVCSGSQVETKGVVEQLQRMRFHRKVLGSGADQVDPGGPLVSLQTITALMQEPQKNEKHEKVCESSENRGSINMK